MILLVVSGSVSASNWWEKIKVKGDFRYRHEMIDKEGSDTRNRQRIRARLGISGEVNSTMSVGIQLATGSDDPVSTNQTLTDGFSTKSIMLDKAYLKYSPTQVPGLTVEGGKFGNPFYKPGSSELIWDSDLNPEGGVANYKRKLDYLTLNLIGAGLWVVERSSGDDSWLGAGQAILGYESADELTSISFGGSFYNYVNAKGYPAFFDATEPMGNSVDGSGNYLNDYELLEAFVEVTHRFDKIPVVVMGDYVNNTAADSVNTGWLVGAHIGKAKKTGSWSVRYIYRKVEKDAVIGIFTDSDFRGGGTDAKGHEIGGEYMLADNAAFGVSYFINKTGLDAAEADFNRLQVDLQLKF